MPTENRDISMSDRGKTDWLRRIFRFFKPDPPGGEGGFSRWREPGDPCPYCGGDGTVYSIPENRKVTCRLCLGSKTWDGKVPPENEWRKLDQRRRARRHAD